VANVSLFGGLALLSYGGYLAWRPMGFIVPGMALFALGVAAELR
jgi:hypothetical protein